MKNWGKISSTTKWLMLFLLVAAALMLYRVALFVKVDGCLDSGGRWDYSKQMCEW